jgi:SPP1 gp7 family putative phage head morphogenesis protein
MVAIATATRIAKKLDADQQPIINHAVGISRMIGLQIRQAATVAYLQHTELPSLQQLITDAMFPTLLDSMVVMTLKGAKIHSSDKERPLALSMWGVISNLLKKIVPGKFDDYIIDLVKSQLGTKAANDLKKKEFLIRPDERLRNTLKRMADAKTVNALRKQYGEQTYKTLQIAGASTDKKIRTALQDAIQNNLPPQAGIVALRKAFLDSGIVPRSDYQLESIFRTQSQIAYNAGRWSADQAPEIQDVLWGYQYATVGDNRVRESHADLEGVTLPKDDPFWRKWWPPNGWNCRCTAIPLYEKHKLVYPKPGILPDPGFAFNAGIVFGT